MRNRIIAALLAVTILATGPAAAFAKPKLALNPANHKNPGAIAGYNEAMGMIDIAKRAKIIADKKGFDSKIFWDGYRDGGGVESLKREVANANAYKPSVFVAMHSDGIPQSRGILVLYKDEAGKKAGSVMGPHIAKKMGLKFEGLSHRPGLLVLRQSKAPAILIEYLSHANPSDNKKLNDPAYRAKLAKATVEGYAKYMGYKISPDKPVQKPKPAAKPVSVKVAKTIEKDAKDSVEGITKDVMKVTDGLESVVGPDKKDDNMIKIGEQLKIRPVTEKSGDFQKVFDKVEESVKEEVTVPSIIKESLKTGLDYLKISFGLGGVL